MSLPHSVAEVLNLHVTLEVESIDRMPLNAYQPRLQTDRGVAALVRFHRRETFASSALMNPMRQGFIAAVDRFVKQQQIRLITFTKGQRMDDVTELYRSRFGRTEGIGVVGNAQEKTPVFRTEKRRNSRTGQTYPWIVRTRAAVNRYYFHGIDADFSPFFLEFCTYFSYNAKLCVNGHEYVKRQLAKEGISFQRLDNGILNCTDRHRLQQLCDSLSAHKIDALLWKWPARILHPFLPKDRAVCYRYAVSILQAEFCLTQVLDRPRTGILFFEEVVRENLDVGRPDRVQLVFGRRINRTTQGRFRTRVPTKGATPSLRIDFKHSRIKQYYKEGRALRTETTINDLGDFNIGKRVSNLPAVRRIGFLANRRLLNVQRISQDCALGEDAFHEVNGPVELDGQRARGLRFADTAVQALFSALLVFQFLPRGSCNSDLRNHSAPLLGKAPEDMTRGQLIYHLRRLGLHALIERTPGAHNYGVTRRGCRTALFYTRAFNRIQRPGLAQIVPTGDLDDSALRRGFDRLHILIDRWLEQKKVPA
jgi:hypothetical protein